MEHDSQDNEELKEQNIVHIHPSLKTRKSPEIVDAAGKKEAKLISSRNLTRFSSIFNS